MQKSDKWEKIAKARELLNLGDSCSINELKQAFRELAKVHHPDKATATEENTDSATMQDLNDAYRILLEYCEKYPISLVRGETSELDDEDWWMNRFGNDPLWGRKKG